jgi:hypothetical protein
MSQLSGDSGGHSALVEDDTSQLSGDSGHSASVDENKRLGGAADELYADELGLLELLIDTRRGRGLIKCCCTQFLPLPNDDKMGHLLKHLALDLPEHCAFRRETFSGIDEMVSQWTLLHAGQLDGLVSFGELSAGLKKGPCAAFPGISITAGCRCPVPTCDWLYHESTSGQNAKSSFSRHKARHHPQFQKLRSVAARVQILRKVPTSHNPGTVCVWVYLDETDDRVQHDTITLGMPALALPPLGDDRIATPIAPEQCVSSVVSLITIDDCSSLNFPDRDLPQDEVVLTQLDRLTVNVSLHSEFRFVL